MREVFISYARDDEFAARLIAERLSSVGLSVFLDKAGIVAGESWSDRMKSELARASVILVLLSSNSRRNTFVEDEVQAALETKKLVVPVLLDEKATQNWLWPLLATRQSFRLEINSPTADEQIRALVELLHSFNISAVTPLSVDSSSTAKSREGEFSLWKAVALAVVSAALGVLGSWLAR